MGVVEIVTPDHEVVQEIDRRDSTHVIEVSGQHEDRVFVQIETATPILLRVLDRTGIPVEMPFEISDCKATRELTTIWIRLSALVPQLGWSDLEPMAGHIRDSVRSDRIPSDYQQEIDETALGRGDYDSPCEHVPQ